MATYNFPYPHGRFVFTNTATFTSTVGNSPFQANADGSAIKDPFAHATIANYGVINASLAGAGIELVNGGTVTNSGTITTANGYGVEIFGGSGTVVNSGAIIAGGPFSDGIYLGSGGTVTNSGTIISGQNGILIANAAGTVVNSGTITATNGSYNGIGVYFGSNTAPSTLTNSGTINSANGANGTAVQFSGSDNRLIVDPGAVFTGKVDGGTGSNTLELAQGSTKGVLSGFGAEYENFDTITVDPNASWKISGPVSGATGGIDIGNNSALEFAGPVASGEAVTFASDPNNTDKGLLTLDQPSSFQGAIQNFQPGDTLDLAGVPALDQPSYKIGSGVLQLTNNGAPVDTLSLSIDPSLKPSPSSNPGGDPVFSAQSDGHGGTFITLTEKHDLFSGIYPNGIVLDNPATQNPATITSIGQISNNGIAVNGETGTAWTISNSGIVTGNGPGGIGVSLASGGTITNGQSGSNSALISGSYNGIVISGAPGSVANYGTIQGSAGIGVYLSAGGTVTNQGIINASYDGLYVGGGLFPHHGGIPGKVVNGAADNHAALIKGSSNGIVFAGPDSTVENFGSIDGHRHGGYAVYFLGDRDRIVDHPRASFVGAISAAVRTGNVLELAKGSQVGAIRNLYGQFAGFTASVKVDAGARWRLANSGYKGFSFTNDGVINVTGSPFVFGAVHADPRQHGRINVVGDSTVKFVGTVGPRETVAFNGNAGTVQLDDPQGFHGTIAGFGAGHAIDLSNQQVANVSFNGGQLTVFGQDGSTLETLAVSGNFSSNNFQLLPDNHGGTLLTFSNGST